MNITFITSDNLLNFYNSAINSGYTYNQITTDYLSHNLSIDKTNKIITETDISTKEERQDGNYIIFENSDLDIATILQ